jgi:hypothetical protein
MSECSNFDVIENLIEDGSATGTDWHIINNNGAFKILNNCSGEALFSILENGYIGLGEYYTSNVIGNYSNVNFVENFTNYIDNDIINTSNYVLYRTNILELTATSNNINISNYVRSTSNTLVNYNNLTNKLVQGNGILIQEGTNIISTIQNWTNISSNDIYYNSFGNVGIGVTPASKLHIYDEKNENAKLIVQNNIINSLDIDTQPQVPSIQIPGVIDKYLKFTYTTDTYGLLGQTQYTFTIPDNVLCDILIIGGGGAGGYSLFGGGGGAGGYVYLANVTLSPDTYIINVGKGGSAIIGNGENGYNSSLENSANVITALGGGGGAGGSAGGSVQNGRGSDGGSGGGGSVNNLLGLSVYTSGGNSTQNSIYGYGNGGNGNGFLSTSNIGGGGGGASGAALSGTGANGFENSITGVPLYYAGGGGAGTSNETLYNGGLGGGGRGGNIFGFLAISGTNGYGGGGGGGGGDEGGLGEEGEGFGGDGGSGVVVIRYKRTVSHVATFSSSIELTRGVIDDSNTDYKIGNYNGDFKIISSTSGINTDALVINQNGNVGIGTITPASKLYLYDDVTNATKLTLHNNFTASNAITSSSIELIRGTSNDNNPDYKIGNYEGDFKIISSTSGINTDALVINQNGNITIGGNVTVGNVTATSFFGNGNGISGVLLTSNDTNLSNYVLSTSNILVNRTRTEESFGSNYVGRLNTNASNYVLSTSNILVDRIRAEVGFGSNYVGRLNANASNYVISTSNILVDRIRAEVGFGSNYIGRLNTNASNYVLLTSNILANRIVTEIGFGSNYVGRLDANISNYVLSTSNILVERIVTEVSFGSNHSIILDSNISNYVLSTNDSLVERIVTEVGFGSNYSTRLDASASNNVLLTSNILVNRIRTEVGFGSNYSVMLDANISNYVLSTNDSLANRITNLVTDDITETINSENKFIVNDRYNNNLLVNGTLTINSNLVVLGESTRLETIVYTTERLEVVNENTTSVALKIQQKDIYTDIFNASNSNAIVFNIANNGDVNISGTYKKNNRDILNDTSNYVVSTSNILVNRIKSEDVFGSNYSRRLDSNISNYVVSTSNILVNRIKSEDIFGSNYSRILDSNVSNYVSLTSNILINIIDSVSSKWTISETGIYNNTANVGIGTSSPSNKLHIYNDTSNAIKLTIQNNIPPNNITSTPAATTTGYTNNYIYMVFTYTTDTEQFSGATQYTINVPTGGKTCDILMVGGGGAGGKEAGAGGGGGAVLYGTNINIPAGAYILRVGRGATPGEFNGTWTTGFGATILGGGSAGNYPFGGPTIANNGGSGSGHKLYSDFGVGGVDISRKGTILTDAIVYNGNIGSFGQFPPAGGLYGGGGGGAGSPGKESGDGGDGVLVNITGTNYYWGGGGGGGSAFNTAKNGGLGGGGAGIDYQNYGNIYGAVDENFSYTIPIFMNGGQHTGGGGGGGGYANNTAGNGGSGIIILRYLESTSTSIELLRGNITDYNTDYKIGNYEGDFKIISSTSGINTDALVINQNGNLKVGGNVVVGNVTATSFFGNGNGISGVLLTSNDTNLSNYVISTSNILVDRTRAEVGFGSNYVGRLDANISNYVISTSNTLVDRTRAEVGFGSNYVGRLDTNLSNYVLSTSNTLVDRTRAEVGFGSNYVGRLDANISNYVISTSNILVNRIGTGGGGGSSQWTTSNNMIYYNTSNVGIGTYNPASELHIYNYKNDITSLLIQNDYDPVIIKPPIPLISSLDNGYSYAVFNYTIDNVPIEDGISTPGQTEYTFTLLQPLISAQVLIVGGGGAGGQSVGGGGGGGDVFFSTMNIPAGEHKIRVGRGGIGKPYGQYSIGEQGYNSSLILEDGTTYTYCGGGAGGTWQGDMWDGSDAVASAGRTNSYSSGGGGGGGEGSSDISQHLGGSGGLWSGKGGNGTERRGQGGGGGAVGDGEDGGDIKSGDGGLGMTIFFPESTISSSYGGGGGGGGIISSQPSPEGSYSMLRFPGNGIDGGGNGAIGGIRGPWGIGEIGDGLPEKILAGNGINGTGGGGGGGSSNNEESIIYEKGGNGGHGVVIIKFLSFATNSTINLVCANNTDYKIGNYEGDFKIISSTSGINTDALVINQSSNVVVGGSVNATSFIGDGSRLSGVLVTSNNTNLSNYILSSSNILVDRTMTEVGFGSNYVGRLDANISNYVLSTSNILVDRISSSSSQWTTLNNSIYYNSNVGIGTSFPNNKLHLYDEVNNTTKLTIQNNNLGIVTLIPTPEATISGTIEGSTDKFMIFTSGTYNFNVPPGGINCDILMIGGGGAGGILEGGGGGAGACIVAINQTLGSGICQVVVGEGDIVSSVNIGAGGDSSISLSGNVRFLARGGGRGGFNIGSSGGCGGGGGGRGYMTTYIGGIPLLTNIVNGSSAIIGPTGPVTNGINYVVCGNKGGDELDGTSSLSGYSSAGGGGIGAAGADHASSAINGTAGGNGLDRVTINSNIYIFKDWFANGETFGANGGFIGGGGGGYSESNGTNINANVGGLGGGGMGFYTSNQTNPAPGLPNTGSGGGGVGYANNNNLGNGGSGIVIIRYREPFIIGSSTIELTRGTSNDNNTDYKIGNYDGDFKIITSTSGINTDALVINESGNVAIEGNVNAASFIGDGSRLSGVLVTSNNTNLSNYVLSTSNILVNRVSSSSQWTTSNTGIYYNSNVGIGTSFPNNKLHIYDDLTNNTSLLIQNNTGGIISTPTPPIWFKGTIGDYKYMMFTYTTDTGGVGKTEYILNVGKNYVFDILIVGGGGSGGDRLKGGGGGGGMVYMVNKKIEQGTYKIIVGNGGINGSAGYDSKIIYNNNTDIIIDSIPLVGKGGGGGSQKNGGSGAGGDINGIGGIATQGNTFWNGTTYIAGGFNGQNGNANFDGAGGGTGEVGGTDGGLNGGDGRAVSITGSSIFYGGGGAGCGNSGGNGGDGGGGASGNGGEGDNGYFDKGGGGGASGIIGIANTGGQGGSGIVIIKYFIPSLSIELITGIDGDSNIDYKIGNYEGDLKITSSTSGIRTDRMIITSTGNVGIGTDYPNSIFQVGAGNRFKIANSSYDYTVIGTDDTNNNTQIIIYGSNFETEEGNIVYIAQSTGSHQFYTSKPTLSEKMRIDENGSVSIGTIDADIYKLNVNGSINTKSLYVNDIAITSSQWIGTTNIYNITGNVGIGTSTTPINLLELTKSSYTGALLSLDAGTVNNTVGAMARAIGKPLLKLGRGFYSSTAGDYYGIGFGYAPLALSNSCCEIGCIITNIAGVTGVGDLVFSTRPTTTDVPATERMRITGTGNVGIGLNPGFLLEIKSGTGTTGSLTNTYFKVSTALTTWTTAVADVCAKFNSSIWIAGGGSVTTSSDSRIKEDIQDINDDGALQSILAIEPKTYKYIDKVIKGDTKVYGFIAQQIREVIPEATSLQKSYIPNIMLLADYITKIITLPLQPTKVIIKKDDKIKCYDKDDKDIFVEVEEVIDGLTFRIKEPEKEYTDTKIFVYGTHIDDFHTLDKNYIYTLNVCATQELHRRIEAQNITIKAQEERIKELETKMVQVLNHVSI